VTKGSFYWHFTDRDALLAALVERWSAITDALIAEVAFHSTPLARLEALILAVHRSIEGVRRSRAMGALAAHATLGARMRVVAERRHRFVSDCFQEMGLAPSAAEASAKLLHAATLGVGELQLLGLGFDKDAERHAYIEALLAMVRGLAAKAAR
ncbi:MAG TPA: TetR/AcrR family transcriptional regulator, partial [Polyangiales bacterium]|nr:TetR/AcrR family transcriptional regulator [Polyangiales bacterium]